MGAEIGNSTQKLHARGPIGLRELCTFKYLVEGSGSRPAWRPSDSRCDRPGGIGITWRDVQSTASRPSGSWRGQPRFSLERASVADPGAGARHTSRPSGIQEPRIGWLCVVSLSRVIRVRGVHARVGAPGPVLYGRYAEKHPCKQSRCRADPDRRRRHGSHAWLLARAAGDPRLGATGCGRAGRLDSRRGHRGSCLVGRVGEIVFLDMAATGHLLLAGTQTCRPPASRSMGLLAPKWRAISPSTNSMVARRGGGR